MTSTVRQREEREVAARPPGVFSAAWTILRKDLRLEARTRESVVAMVLFSLTVFVLFHFGLDRPAVSGSLASGILWVTLLLATVLGVNRLFASEHSDGALSGVLLAPIDRTAIYLAKAAALLIYLAVLEVVALLAFDLLLLGPPLSGAFPGLLAVVALADVGLAAVGALVAGLAVETRAREVIVPLALLPLLVPVLIGAANATAPLLSIHPHAAGLAKWLGLVAVYDMTFVLLAVAVFDYLMED